MKYIKRFNEEHNFRDEVEKIYTDKDLVCLIPKTQKCHIYTVIELAGVSLNQMHLKCMQKILINY